MSKKLTKEDFIKKAIEKHGDKYDYANVDYKDSKTKVCIICHKHGEFEQTPNNHMQGHGCQKCKADKTCERLILSKEGFIKKGREVYKEDFIKKAIEKHGDKYDYSKVDYKDSKTKVCIICPKHGHGEFWQEAASHTQGCGCPKCMAEANGDRKRLTKEEFIKKANEVHQGKYNYGKVKYVNSQTKVCISCPEDGHGEFWQKPYHHTRGAGCPKCNLSHLERSVMHYLDDVGITYDYQKCFDWLGKQSLDFYLPDYNVGIECQGGQHFFPIDFAGKGVEWACEHFKYVISLDKRKKALCDKHGIKLLYFGNVPNYDTFLGEAVHDDVQFLIDYLEEHKKTIDHAQTIQVDV